MTPGQNEPCNLVGELVPKDQELISTQNLLHLGIRE